MPRCKLNRPLTLFLFLLSFLIINAAYAQEAVPGDYDGDGRSDIVVTRKIGLYWFWFVRLATGQEVDPQIFGLSATDTVLAGDWDGDGDFSPAVVRANPNGFLYLYTMRNDGAADELQWGLVGDTVVTINFGGRDYYGVIRNQGGYLYWYLGGEPFVWGLQGDSTFAGDFAGDGHDEPVVARQMLGGYTWFIRDNADNPTIIQWGLSTDTPLKPYDFDGDAKDDLVVVRSEAGALVAYIRLTGVNGQAKGTQAVTFGLTGDTPFIGSFNVGNQGEFGVYRQTSGGISRHYIKALGSIEQRVDFGLEGDTLVRPDGTPVTPQSGSGNGGGGSGNVSTCSIIHSSGWLLKPASQDSGGTRQGKPLILFSRNLPRSSCLNVLATNGTVIAHYGEFSSERYYSGYGCGERYSAGQLAQLAENASGSDHIYLQDPSTGACYGSGPADGRTDRR